MCSWSVLAVVLVACGSAPTVSSRDGLPVGLEDVAARCASAPEGAWDWCLVQAAAELGQSGSADARIELCGHLAEPDAADACVEQALIDHPTLPGRHCGRIGDPRTRASCQLVVADRVVVGDAVLDEVLDACLETGPLLEHCLVHLIEERGPRWVDAGYGPLMTSVGTVLREVPLVAEMTSLGAAVGDLAALGGHPALLGPCEYLPEGAAYSACLDKQEVKARGPTP